MKNIFIFGLLVILSGCAMQGPMVASPTGDGKYWVLQDSMVYEHPVTHERVEIPRGIVTDLASVPRLFWTAFPPCGKYTSAAVLHDYLYWVQSDKCDQKCSDDVLLLAMQEAGVDAFTSNSIYTAVRVGGKSSWEKNAKLKSSGVIRVIPEEHMGFGAYDSWEQIQNKINSAKAAKHDELPNKESLPGRQKAQLAYAHPAFCLR